MAKKKFDDEDLYEDEDEEENDDDEDDEFKKDVKERERKLLPSKQKEVRKNKDEEKEGTTYSAYHLPERAGVKNDKDNQPVGEDVYTILASIKTDLQELKDGLL